MFCSYVVKAGIRAGLHGPPAPHASALPANLAKLTYPDKNLHQLYRSNQDSKTLNNSTVWMNSKACHEL